ncbi:MAG: glycosyltransferase family 2 protein [Myxococcota bacterium]
MSEAVKPVDLSIIVPCYNEVGKIATHAGYILDFCAKQFRGKSIELILIDDGSTDGTTAVLQQLINDHPQVKAVFFAKNKGRGCAIKAGFKKSVGDLLIVLDADLSYDVKHIERIMQAFDSDDAIDAVVVSPYMRGGTTRGVPPFRLVLSRLANWLFGGSFFGRPGNGDLRGTWLSRRFDPRPAVVRGRQGTSFGDPTQALGAWGAYCGDPGTLGVGGKP